MVADTDFIERRIVTGLIVSTDYLRRVRPFWKPDMLESPELRRVAGWCWSHFEEFNKAPDTDIETIFMTQRSSGAIPKAELELIERALERASRDFGRGEQFSAAYLYKLTIEHFRHRELSAHTEKVQALLERNKTAEAAQLQQSFQPSNFALSGGVTLGSDLCDQMIDELFSESAQRVLRFPGALGNMLNEHLVRSGFVAFLAPEKRGKCLPGDQLILMATGETIPLHQVMKEKRRDIVAYDEETDKFIRAEVSHFHCNGPKKVWMLSTRTGRKVKVTGNHPLLTPTGWRELSDLSVGQYVAVPRHIPIFGESQMPDHQVRLLAYLLTDGGMSGKGVTFSKADYEIQNDFTSCVESMGCQVRWKGIAGEVVNGVGKERLHGKNYVKQFIEGMGLLGKRSYEKWIPSEVYQLPKSKLALFLSVLFTCDGWVCSADSKSGKANVGFTVASEKMARQVQELLSRFGIVSHFRSRENDTHGANTVGIGEFENIKRFGDEIGFRFGDRSKFVTALGVRSVSKRSFLDKFPPEIALKFYNELEMEFGVAGTRRDRWAPPERGRFQAAFSNAPIVREQIAKGQLLMRQSFREVENTVAGTKYMNSAVLWDEITNITYVGVEETYDLTVDTYHTFVAENVVVHNSWLLLEIAWRALSVGRSNVAFFAAGDMTEKQLIGRFAVRLTRRNLQEKYCGEHWAPVGDCALNQIDKCDLKERAGDFGVRDADINNLEAWKRRHKTLENFDVLTKLAEQYPKYKPCDARACKQRCGTVWLQKEPEREALSAVAAKNATRKFRENCKRILRIKSYDTGTLTAAEIKAQLDTWEKEDDFVPDVVIVDYPDIMRASNTEFRHGQNEIWMGLRGVSINRDCLVVAVTQSDAASYSVHTLALKNFSEDKRKYAHVTAMWGLNQSPDGREKRLGLLRIGELLVREGESNPGTQVVVMQDLWTGRAYIGSYVSRQDTFDSESEAD